MNRSEQFIAALADSRKHPMLGRVWTRLTDAEERAVYDFITSNMDDGPVEFEKKINRLFMDVEKKPKHWKEICEILSNINSAMKPSLRDRRTR